MNQLSGPVVVGLGRASIDFLGVIDGYPQPDAKHELRQFSIQGGGPAATALVTIHRLGLTAQFIGKVGDDYFGRFMIDSLIQEGVNVENVRIESQARSQFACISIDALTGGRTILWSNGTVSPLSVAELPARLPSQIHALHLDGHHLEAAAHLAARVRGQGAVISYDAGTVRPGVERLLPLTDILVTTRSFAFELTGKSEPESALKALKSTGAAIVGITLGASGSIAWDGATLVRCGAYPIHAVDTTGAGDVYHGAFLVGYLNHWPLPRIVAFANATAALKCRSIGGRPGIPRLPEVIAYMEQHDPEPFAYPD